MTIQQMLSVTFGDLRFSPSSECSHHFSDSGSNFLIRLCFAVFDSSAKIPSGLFDGNINQYGDFDQCLDFKTELDPPMYPHLENYRIVGKYCLATLDLDIRKSSGHISVLVEVDGIMHSHRPIISTVHDVSSGEQFKCKAMFLHVGSNGLLEGPSLLSYCALAEFSPTPYEFVSLLNRGSCLQMWVLTILYGLDGGRSVL